MHVHTTDVPRVFIDGSPQPPNEVIYVGKTRKITCTAEGFPVPTVQWYEDNKLVHSSTLPFSTLEITTNITRMVTYTCIATNNAGNKTHTSELIITVEVKGR